MKYSYYVFRFIDLNWSKSETLAQETTRKEILLLCQDLADSFESHYLELH
jgi:hypothetical protein